ncbi:MAG TPA: hypothetical protein ENN06_09310 [Desulfobacteraceae bacterium]|nr:hypothetical protein [Desulfobacteraceae bacterium]
MYFFDVLISGVWGFLSPWLFLNGWLAFLGMAATGLVYLRGRLALGNFLHNLFRFFSELVFHFVLLLAGFYIIYEFYNLGETRTEIITYGIVATVQMFNLLANISRKIDELLERARQ